MSLDLYGPCPRLNVATYEAALDDIRGGYFVELTINGKRGLHQPKYFHFFCIFHLTIEEFVPYVRMV